MREMLSPESLIHDRLGQLKNGLTLVTDAEDKARENGGNFYTKQVIDGKETDVMVDKRMILMMKGGVLGAYRELLSEGHGMDAAVVLADYKKKK